MKILYYTALIIILSTSAFSQQLPNLSLKTGEIFFKNFELSECHELPHYRGYIYGIVRFDQIPNHFHLTRIKKSGLELSEFLGQTAYLCRFKQDDFENIRQLNLVTGLATLHPERKITSTLREKFIKKTSEKKVHFSINIALSGVTEAQHFVTEMKAAGIVLFQNGNAEHLLKGSLTSEQIYKVATHPYVVLIDNQAPPGEKEDLTARNLHRTSAIDQQFAQGLHYDGTGVNVLVRDDGKIGPHIDYQGRTNQYYAKGDGENSTHGDMVSGILMGAGNLNPDVTGMARGAFLYITNYESEFTDVTMQLYAQNNVLVTSSSYSDGCNTGYTMNAQTTDKQIFNNPDLIHVFSAGNSGQNDCNYGAGAGWGNITGGHKSGKNSIATGNVNQNGGIDITSSRGPAYDGRIKPDICANGTDQLSTYPNNTINTGGGTSAAAPGISGSIAQLIHSYRDMNNGATPPSALIKASMLNTATDLGNPGPDFTYGWGLVNTRKAYELLKAKQYKEIDLSDSEQKEWKISVPNGTASLRVMVYWADKEASVLATKALVNDIDMQVISEDNTMYLPYVLDNTPDPVKLSSPAKTGADHLNNMEQVEIFNPSQGDYTVQLYGFQIPFGTVKAWLVYEMSSTTPVLTFPNGGESFNPGENIYIHWDAIGNTGNYTIDYSADNGKSWNQVKTVGGNQKRTIWKVPDSPVDSALLRINRNGESDTVQAPFTILKQVSNLTIDNICPTSAQLSWSNIAGASKYVLHELKERYMEPFDTVTSNTAIINNYPGNVRWISVRPISQSGMPGKRSVATKLHKLLNCKQQHDIAIYADTSTKINQVLCGPTQQVLGVMLKNEGSDTVKQINLHYIIDQNPVKNKHFSTMIAPDSSMVFHLDTIIPLQSFQFTMNVWADIPGETAHFNDSLLLNFNWQVQDSEGADLPYSQDFESDDFPPIFWTTLSLNPEVNWDTLSCIGINGQQTRAAWMNNYNNFATGTTDDLITQKFNLTNTQKAYLVFDYAYTGFDNTYNDTLEVDISNDCGKTYFQKIIRTGGGDLQTTPNLETTFVPVSGYQWGTSVTDLGQYTGQSVNFRFRNISGYGNSLFIDNIRVVNIYPTDPMVEYSSNKYCFGQLDEIKFFARPKPNTKYHWDFGTGAIPTFSSGPGPHYVKYTNPGKENVSLIVIPKFGNADTISVTEIDVYPETNAGFTFVKNGFEYSFSADQDITSSQHFWEFGDSQTSQETNPVHTYSTSGTYIVTHIITDSCGTDTSSHVLRTVSTKDEFDQGLLVYPNPASAEVYIISNNTIQHIELYNLIGQLMPINTVNNQKLIKLDTSQLSTGIYFVHIKLPDTNLVRKIQIIRN